jgi:hypothetical protein
VIWIILGQGVLCILYLRIVLHKQFPFCCYIDKNDCGFERLGVHQSTAGLISGLHSKGLGFVWRAQERREFRGRQAGGLGSRVRTRKGCILSVDVPKSSGETVADLDLEDGRGNRAMRGASHIVSRIIALGFLVQPGGEPVARTFE